MKTSTKTPEEKLDWYRGKILSGATEIDFATELASERNVLIRDNSMSNIFFPFSVSDLTTAKAKGLEMV
jgi:hypothetical protein